MARAVTRRAFKTKTQLAASEAARWKLANSLLGWHEQQPVAETKPTGAKKSVRAATSKRALREPAAGVAQQEDVKEKVVQQEDVRPRKRAVVRKPRKQKVNQSSHSKNGDDVSWMLTLLYNITPLAEVGSL